MRFSICIPNFNYDRYLPETLESVRKQTHNDYEVIITDNASTDRSVEVIRNYAEKDPRFRYKVNLSNLGFAGNLDEAGRMAKEEYMIMLSSDDVITESALQEYDKFIGLIEMKYGKGFIFCSTFEKIDGEGKFIEYITASNSSSWEKNDIDMELSELMGCPVFKVRSEELLKRCLKTFLNPFNFAATCYPKKLFESVGGYGGGRLYNPDKWFHWKILSICDYAYYLEKPLFKYRWHQNNQLSIEKQTGVLKFWLDEYRNSFEIDELMLNKADIKKDDVIKSFCVHVSKYIFAAIRQKIRKVQKD